MAAILVQLVALLQQNAAREQHARRPGQLRRVPPPGGVPWCSAMAACRVGENP